MPPELIVAIDIGLAALIGSTIGSFFDRSLAALLWTTPLVAAAQGIVAFIAPAVRANPAAPPWAHEAADALGDPFLILQVLIASATGALVGSLMMRHVRKTRSAPVWLPSMSEGSAARPAVKGPAPRRKDTALGERIGAISARPQERRPQEQAIFELAAGPAEPPPAPVARPEPPPPATEAAGAAPETPPRVEKRRQTRRRTLLAGRIVLDDESSFPCTIQNLSVSGAQVKLAAPLPLPQTLRLIDMTHGIGHEAELTWRKGAVAGLEFHASYDLKNPKTPRAKALQEHRAALAAR